MIYQFDVILAAHGCMSSGSIIAHLNYVFYLSTAGFQMFDGQNVTPIGAEQVDRWFFRDAKMDLIDQMRGGVDPVQPHRDVGLRWRSQSGQHQ